MSRHIPFGIGVLLGSIFWVEEKFHFEHIAIGGLVLSLGYALVGWFSYAMALGKSQRSSSKALVFCFGILAMSIQVLIIRYVAANATDIQGLKSAWDFSFFLTCSRLAALVAWFTVPLLLCSVVAGRIVRMAG